MHLFGIPRAKTPVCTTELVSLASCAEAWAANNIKHLALTGSTVSEQIAWHEDIERVFKTRVGFPGAHDPGRQLTRLFGMLHEKRSRDCGIRKSFVVDPAHQIRMILEYPLNVGRNSEELLRVMRALQLRAETGVATPADWYSGDVVIVNDDRPEAEVIAEFGNGSIWLTDYLRVVTPRNPRVVSGSAAAIVPGMPNEAAGRDALSR